MRESIGGAWLTGIVICFLFLFAAFLTYAINYTKAFRVKDRIIQIIEENEGYTLVEAGFDVKTMDMKELEASNTAEAEIMYFVNKIGYKYPNSDTKLCPDNEIEGPGYCLQKHCVNSDNTNRVYYKVTSYISLTIPVVNVVVKIPISGETTSLYFDRTGMDASTSDHNCYK